MHFIWVLCFVVLYALTCFLKKKWKVVVLVIEGLFALVCAMDYSITMFRGIGFVSTDFKAGSTVGTILLKNGIPTGKKFWMCVLWLIASMIFVCVKDRFIKNPKWNKQICALGLLGFIGLGIITTYPNEYELFRGNAVCSVPDYSKDISWDTRDRLVLHALGITAQGDTLTNSRNALEYNYAKGARTFETDISFTSDGIPVLRHDWGSDLGQAKYFGWSEENTFAPTYEEFMNAPIYDLYTPMSLLDLLQFMKSHEDVYVVTDVKLDGLNTIEMQYTTIVEIARENDLLDVLDRLVIQIYYQGMYDMVQEVYPFKNVVFTLYVVGEQPKEELRDFLMEHDMKSVTMTMWYAKPETCAYLAEEGIKVYTHTFNTPDEVKQNYERGVYGIYTDVFMPAELEALHKGF